MSINFDYLHEVSNPLDDIEDLFKGNNWVFNRISDDELSVNVTGKSGRYNMIFVWQDDMSALQFCSQYDFSINGQNREKAAPIVMGINHDLWMGRFDIAKETGVPCFRHTCLYRGMGKTRTTEQLEDLIDIGLALCENHHSAFYILSHANDSLHEEKLPLALMDIAGEC